MTKEQAADLMAPLDLEGSYRLNPRPLHQLSGRTGSALYDKSENPKNGVVNFSSICSANSDYQIIV
jgi:hypothetical protein